MRGLGVFHKGRRQETRNKAQETLINKQNCPEPWILDLVPCLLCLVPCTLILVPWISFTFASMKILMVCLGNICRSPLAEGILRDKIEKAHLNWTVDSAGTNGYHVGEAPHPLSQKVARLNSIDISRQRARRFTAADFQRFDKIYAMAGDVIDEMRRIAGRQFDST